MAKSLLSVNKWETVYPIGKLFPHEMLQLLSLIFEKRIFVKNVIMYPAKLFI